MTILSGIQTKAVVKYAILPGIVPRMKALFASGFGYLAFLMAQIYAGVRLLPANHPYLKPANIGQFGMRHVVAAAANNLVISKRNIDQIAIFTLILFGIVLLACQFGLLIFGFLIGTADATSFFVTPNPTNDVAFILLDQVFGLPTFFNSCVAQGTACALGTSGATMPVPAAYPWPFHIAIHQMFRFYSLAMLVVGALIFLYFLMVIVAETATSGTPFGQRFQNIWVPIRLVMAIGLLVPLPIAYGAGTTAAYNTGQYLTFFAAKVGSSLATNGWRIYNDAIGPRGTANPLGENQALIAHPTPPDASTIVETLALVHTCAYTHYLADNNIIKDGAATGTQTQLLIANSTTPTAFSNAVDIRPYFVKVPTTGIGNQLQLMPVDAATTYEQGLDFYNQGNIRIRFGKPDPNDANKILPTCGDILIQVGDRRLPTAGGGNLGPVEIQKMYFEEIRNGWWGGTAGPNGIDEAQNYLEFAGRMALKNENRAFDPCDIGCGNASLPGCGPPPGNPLQGHCSTDEPRAIWRSDTVSVVQTRINTRVTEIWTAYAANAQEIAMTTALMDGNWANAGSWFPILAQVNGAFTDAIINIPRLEKYPEVMEEVREVRRASSPFLSPSDMFNPNQKQDQNQFPTITLDHPDKNQAAQTLSRVFNFFNSSLGNATFMDKVSSGGSIKDLMNSILGTYGLYDMRANRHVHPLAQLTALGKGLVEASIRNVAISTMAAGAGGLLKAMDGTSGNIASAVAGFFVSTAFIGLSAGIVLFYIVPFLPFVYFYFAVASWIKTIFEAMVGVPLWALAHLRIDGDGLPGEAASNGYFLILEIFLRPILTVAGLIAAMTIFTAQAYILNSIWSGTVENVGGFDNAGIVAGVGDFNLKRSEVDQFFFTIIYAMVIYMAATACFKLVDTIPDNILRWAGQGVSSFGDINQDAAEGLTQYAALGGITSGRQVVQGTNQLAGGLGGALGSAVGRVGTP